MSPKIMVVDDEPEFCKVMSDYLCKRGYRVVVAYNTPEALSKIVDEKPAMVLLDIRLPRIDGIECLRRIRKLDKKALVIMVTVVDDLERAKHAMKLGATDYITKPLGFNALAKAISTYLLFKNE